MNILSPKGKVASATASLALAACLAFALPFGSAFGQPDLNLQNTTSNSPGSADILFDFTNNTPADVCGISVCIVFDPTEVTNVDLSSCLDGVPEPHGSSTFSACELETGGGECDGQGFPVNETIRLALVDFAETIDDFSGAGPITVDIASGLSTGSTVTLTNNIVEVLDCSGGDITPGAFTDAEIGIVEDTAVLNVQPPSINFGNQEINTTSSAQQVTISNDGTDGIDMQVSDVSLATGTDYILANGTCGTTPFTLADGASCTVDVSFNPQSIANNITDTLNVTSDAGSVTNDAVALEGNGVAGPGATLDLTPASFDFGDELTGSGASTTTFTVTNNGDSGSNLSIDTIAISGGDFTVSGGSCSAGTTELGAGASCTIEVEFAPAADGAQSETLSVDGTDTVNSTSLSDSASLDGEGVTQPILSSTPAPGAVNIGTAVIGGSVSRTVTLANDGNAPLDVTCGSPTGDPEITITPDPANFTGIAGGASDSFEVQCDTPEQATYTATLACTSNDPDNPEFTYEFSCTGRPLVVPTMQPWGLAALALLMLIVGGFSIRFFRT
jgi:hypothetical protein